MKDLEVVAKSTEPITHLRPVYTFPRGRISRKPGESRLRSLKLVNCLPPPLDGFTALTTLLLRDLPCSTPAAVYEGVVAACPQLRVLHLVACSFDKDTARWLVFDAPMYGAPHLSAGQQVFPAGHPAYPAPQSQPGLLPIPSGEYPPPLPSGGYGLPMASPSPSPALPPAP